MQLATFSSPIIGQIRATLPTSKGFGVAVSGGSDSLALLTAMQEICRAQDWRIEAMTVDHGLRTEAADEADHVRKVCTALSVPHATARWTGWNGEGNLQDAARRARYRLIAEWAIRRNLEYVCIGHTQDDVAETFLMRLSRESGVDGLARMDAEFERDGAKFVRPMLGIPRDSLRDFLKTRGVEWCDDPTNENENFDRVRTRRALNLLQDVGIEAKSLAVVSQNLASVRDALKESTAELVRKSVQQEFGDLLIDRDLFLYAAPELRRRILNGALSWVGQGEYPVRRQSLNELDEAITEKRHFSCNGCLIRVTTETVRIYREFNAVRDLVEFAPTWDRWRLEGPWQMGLKVKALGEPAIAGLENWRLAGVPRLTLMASPSVWKGDQLIAAPLAGHGEDWTMRLEQADFNGYMSR